jgi:membrane associated rhomboid family serine protease
MDPVPSDRAMARFVLRHRRPSLWRLVLPGALALIIGASVIARGGVEEWPVLMLVVLGAILMPFVIFGMLSRPIPDQWMEVRARSIVLPATSFSAEAIEIPISQIRSIYARLTRDGAVWIETSFRTFIFPLRAFDSQAAAALLVDRVRECIRALPDGEDRIALIDRHARMAERALSTRHAATIATITLLVGAGFLLHLGGAHRWTFGLVRFGANVSFLVREGELYRLIASLFLHAGPVHLAFVIFGIASAGAIVERLLGSVGTIAIMLASGLAGALAMHAGDGFFTVGASPIVFGLMGAAAFVTQQHRDRIPMLLRPTLGMWILIGTFTLPIAVVPEVDFSSNLGGLLAGVVIGALLAGGEGGLPLRGLQPRWAVALIAVLGGAYAYALVTATYAWREYPRATDARVIERSLDLDRYTFEGLNKLAWEVALDPDATPRELELAEIAAQRGVDRSPEVHASAVEDTLATVYYRRQRHADAVALEKAVFAEDPRFASQLALFLRAHAETSTVTGSIEAELSADSVQVVLERPAAEETALYLIAMDGDRLRGLVTLAVPAGAAMVEVPMKDSLAWAEHTQLRLADVDRGKTVRTGAWPIAEDAPKIP